MILNFQKEINGKPTKFPEKIIQGLIDKDIICEFEYRNFKKNSVHSEHLPNMYYSPDGVKLHTIRKDEKNRWEPDVLIDFKQWTGRPYHSKNVSFAPRVPVVSTQEIEIVFYRKTNKLLLIKVDGKMLDMVETLCLAHNDGFDNTIDFISYFKGNFKGKIIHWTNLTY